MSEVRGKQPRFKLSFPNDQFEPYKCKSCNQPSDYLIKVDRVFEDKDTVIREPGDLPIPIFLEKDTGKMGYWCLGCIFEEGQRVVNKRPQ
jgi:hypothetical protein